MAETSNNKVVAYVPFQTFLSAIEELERARELPHQFDSSLWPTYSAASRAQLLGAFRFLRLVDDAGRPTSPLRSLVRDKINRKSIMRKILEEGYPHIIGMNLLGVSPKQFDHAMRQFGMTGETHKKVISFFLRAAVYAELPLSPLLRSKVREAGSRRRKRHQGSVESGSVPPFPASTSASGKSEWIKAIRLRSGGSVTVEVKADILEMAPADRQFVFALFDKLREYEKNENQ
jgi:hypothetical protein